MAFDSSLFCVVGLSKSAYFGDIVLWVWGWWQL